MFDWLPTPTRTGYTFLGWYSKRDGGTKAVANYHYFTDDYTLYAHWEIVQKEYTITFDLNGGDGSKYQKTTSNQKISSYDKPTRKNDIYDYEFIGWYTKKIDGEKCTNDKIYSSDTTLYAHWKPVMPVINDFSMYYHGGGELAVYIDTDKYKAMKYEIQYSTTKKEKKMSSKNTKTKVMSLGDTSVTIKDMKYSFGKVYYIRVRTITTADDGYTYTSEWGNWKKIKIWQLFMKEY